MDSLSSIDSFNRFFSARTQHPQVAVAELLPADPALFNTRRYDMYCLILMEDEFGKLYRDD
ncbi:MAG: hypothetical protein K2J00_08805, partial [Bacteroidaceae bacterium]|nr:hypothetical protein [Bacteroidaceae bacterium]